MDVQIRIFWSETGPELENQVAYSHKAFLGVPERGRARATGDLWFSIFSGKLVIWKI